MKKSTKIWLVSAFLLVITGGIMFVSVMWYFNWDFYKLETEKYETNSYDLNGDFSKIAVNTDTADIIFAASNDGKCRVVCKEWEKEAHSVKVKEDTLRIDTVRDKKWYENIGIFFSSPQITVYLPKDGYSSLSVKESTGNITIPENFKFLNSDISVSTGDVRFMASVSESLKIKTGTGDITAKNLSAGTLDLSVSTGEVRAENITCKNFISKGTTGDIFINNVTVKEGISFERTTGNVNLNKSDASSISVKTTTGDVKGKLLSEKIFITETSTGDINVPKTQNGGRCQISTSTGDIIFKK